MNLLFDRSFFVKGVHDLRNTCYQLSGESISFAVEPCPNNYYAIHYKSDAEKVVAALKKVWGTKI